MIIIWLLSGIVVVTLAFFIPPNSPELWPSLNLAVIPVILYILALGFFTLRSPITLKARIIAWVSIALVGMASFFSWSGIDTQSHWQHNQLLKIHSVIIRSILRTYAPQYELNALNDYYQQGSKKKESLGQIFQRKNNSATVGTNIYKSETPEIALRLSSSRFLIMKLCFSGCTNIAKVEIAISRTRMEKWVWFRSDSH